uniref:uncharacterized protein LOC120347804 n=1 Tax=Styela clava TaxID=7725 RepID=UPI00193A0C66|nr:uncharacterized protein LOC120347804 [Styela clava]
MKIPIRHSFIVLILLVEAYLLIKGEQCWIPMVCHDQLTWRKLTEGQCTKEEEKALGALTQRLDGMKSELYQLEKVLEEAETNSVPLSVVGVKETTTPRGYKDKKTSSALTSIVPATSPWSTKEAFLSTVRPQTTKVEQSTDVLSTTVPNGLEYDGKLFIPLIGTAKSNKIEAESRCNEIGGQLANIYNNDHMDRIGDFIRSNFEIEGSRSFHLGMTYNENESVSFRNGTAVDKTHFRWGAGFTKNNGKLVYLRVTKNEERVNQYLWNWGDVEKFVLCER